MRFKPLPSKGDRIRLVYMPSYIPGDQIQEPDPMIPGTTGTVVFANEMNVSVDWDVDASGRKRSLSLQVGVDEWEVIAAEEVRSGDKELPRQDDRSD